MSDTEHSHRFELQTGRLLERIDDPIKLYKAALARLIRHLEAEGGAVILRHPVSGALRTIPWGRGGRDWDEARVRAFLDLMRPDLPDGEIMAPILIDGRAAGIVWLRRLMEPFPPGSGRRLSRICRKLSHEAALREERRVNRVVDRIKDKTVRELKPKDLFFQILHGLKSLTRYNHSSALLIAEEDGAHLVLHAEQIAWTKTKSRRLGRRIRIPEALRPALRRATAIGIVPFEEGAARNREGGEPDGASEARMARLLRWGGKKREPAEGTILLAPLRHDGQLLGVLKVAALRPGALGAPEARTVARVVPHIASVIHNARRALSMEERIIAAEKKHAMADLARAISHDVKNAIGTILPLAQQVREEIRLGSFERDVLLDDLQQIEQSARVCQRIFDGMLQLARSGVRPRERAPLAGILEGAMAILGPRVKRLGVALEIRVPDTLPEVNASRGGLEQLFLNLIGNALDAMPAGGRLKIHAREAGDRVQVSVIDTGTGIPVDQLKRIHEPFYTTKETGFGLGLAICRSILWENGGELAIDSQPGRGTIVLVTLPTAAPPGERRGRRPADRARAVPGAAAGS